MNEQIYYIEQSRHISQQPNEYSFFTYFSFEYFLNGIEESLLTDRIIACYFRIKLKTK